MVIESIPYEAIGQSRIAFHRTSNNPPGSAGMVILNGRTRTATKHLAHVVGSYAQIEVSPDGTRVAYVQITVANSLPDFIVNTSDLDAPDAIAVGEPGAFRGDPSWTPDGSSVVYTEGDDSQIPSASRIVMQTPSPGSTRQILWQRVTCESAAEPHANAAGDIAFAVTAADCNSHLLARKKPGQQTEILYASGGPLILSPAWSPPGAEIAFFYVGAIGSAVNADLRVMNADGSSLRSLFGRDSYSLPASLCWGADGSTLFFPLGDAPGESHIYAIAAAGGTPVPITTQPGAYDSAVSCLH
jgi:Tol biopolymer transport system component